MFMSYMLAKSSFCAYYLKLLVSCLEIGHGGAELLVVSILPLQFVLEFIDFFLLKFLLGIVGRLEFTLSSNSVVTLPVHSYNLLTLMASAMSAFDLLLASSSTIDFSSNSSYSCSKVTSRASRSFFFFSMAPFSYTRSLIVLLCCSKRTLDSAKSRRNAATSSELKLLAFPPSNFCKAFRICRSFSVSCPCRMFQT